MNLYSRGYRQCQANYCHSRFSCSATTLLTLRRKIAGLPQRQVVLGVLLKAKTNRREFENNLPRDSGRTKNFIKQKHVNGWRGAEERRN